MKMMLFIKENFFKLTVDNFDIFDIQIIEKLILIQFNSIQLK